MGQRPIELSSEDREYLERLLKKGDQQVKVSKRALALLALDTGQSMQAVKELIQVSYRTVLKWRDKYKAEELHFLEDKQRPGRPVVIDGSQRAKITALACSDALAGYERWSLRLLAGQAVELGYCAHISYKYVGEVLKKTN